ncbi:MAG: HPr family phosphocarrier protein [Anaerolineales bacterium]|nr:HPr family phosphocarrier protein [Anaerolineales bacterium]
MEAVVQVRSLTGTNEFVNTKSILSVLTPGVSQGPEIETSAEGPITELIENNFPDEQPQDGFRQALCRMPCSCSLEVISLFFPFFGFSH